MAFKKEVIFFIFVLSIVSCGIKGPPLPPAEEQTVQKQMAVEPSAVSSDTTKVIKEKKTK